MRFEFATANRIIFGPGVLAQVGTLAKEYGRRALLVTGHNPQRAEPLMAQLHAQSIGAADFSVVGEPQLETIERGVALAKEQNCDFVIGFGGGSVLDSGKA